MPEVIISQTPYRVSFFGGGSDYPAWYQDNGGSVLSCTIGHYCTITARFLPPYFEHHSRVVWSKIELVDANTEIQHPSVRACLEYREIYDGVEIHHIGDLPAMSGLGSSSAFTVGLLVALDALKGYGFDGYTAAYNAIKVEQEVLGEAVGIQDQIACAVGGFNRITIARDGTWKIAPVPITPYRQAQLEARLLLYWTGEHRVANEVAKAQLEEMADHTQAMRDLVALVDEAAGALIGPDLDVFGHLLHEGWQIKRLLSKRITNHNLDNIYSVARDAGALGGKVLGAGGGGFMLLYAAPDRQPALREALSSLVEVPFRFEGHGTRLLSLGPVEVRE